MMRLPTTFLLIVIACLSEKTLAQQLISDDEAPFYAETKQITQFIRRFNHEEDKTGKKYSSDDPRYRARKQRLEYLTHLFDLGSRNINAPDQKKFVEFVADKAAPRFLDFYDGEWMAEVKANFFYQGVQAEIQLFFQLVEDHKGYKWVISDAYIPNYAYQFERDTSQFSPFLHPMSHELGFMNLRKTFQTKADSVLSYLPKDYHIDHLSLFMYEFKKGLWKFETVSGTKFHFFQIDGWYFEVSRFVRGGNNSGWLISNLVQVPLEFKEEFKKFVCHRGM